MRAFASSSNGSCSVPGGAPASETTLSRERAIENDDTIMATHGCFSLSLSLGAVTNY